MFGITVSMPESQQSTVMLRVIECSFWKIMVGHRYSDISNMISNIGYSRFVPMTSMLEKQPCRRIYCFSSSLYLFTNLVTTKAEEIDT
jgi:hypothetical protein